MFREIVPALLEIFPKPVVLPFLMFRQILLCHGKRKAVHSDETLSVRECFVNERIDLLDGIVGHRITTNRYISIERW